jgi:hypothetical protein
MFASACFISPLNCLYHPHSEEDGVLRYMHMCGCAGGVAQGLEHLHSKHEALSSIPTNAKKEKKKMSVNKGALVDLDVSLGTMDTVLPSQGPLQGNGGGPG